MDAKKISFGFSKIIKKPNFQLQNSANTKKEENKIELIKCLEGQEIKLVKEIEEQAPLIIPMKENQQTPAAIASLMRRRAVLLNEEEDDGARQEQVQTQITTTEVDPNKASNVSAANDDENIEKRAERELLAEYKNSMEQNSTESGLVLPALKPDELPLDGAKESTLGDYETVPVQDFGMALLRGMGWVEPPKKKDAPNDEGPNLRPKGMGLGADKALKAKPLLVQPEANEVLEIKKQAYVHILGGKYKDLYGQIEGFDDEKGRVIVRMAVGGAREAFNEFLCQPISRKEYAQYGKCINVAKYEEYKKMENEHGQIILKKEENNEKTRIKKDRKHEHKEERYVKQESGRHCDDRVREQNNGKYSDARDDSSLRKYENNHYPTSSSSSNQRRQHDESSSRGRGRTSRSPERKNRDYRMQSSSYRKQRDTSAITSDSSDSDSSDTDDSAYEHSKHKKKSKSKRKSKGSKSKTRKHKRHSTSSTEFTSASQEEDERVHEQRRNHSKKKKHGKKTKKSKKQRSRSRSKCRR